MTVAHTLTIDLNVHYSPKMQIHVNINVLFYIERDWCSTKNELGLYRYEDRIYQYCK